MACLRFAIWLSLLFHDLQLFGVRGAYGEWILVPFPDDFESLKNLQSDKNFQFESANKLIAKRSTDDLQSPQIFKFELNDAKEPDEETKKLIQKRGRELQLKVKEEEVANSTLSIRSKRSKRSAQKTNPQLIPFLITDAKEPDNATKELIRKSRAKDLSLVKTKEPTTRQSRKQKEPSLATQVVEPIRKSKSKPVAVTTQNKEPLRQSYVKSVVVSTQNREPVRKGRVQSVPLTSINDKDSSSQSRGVKEGTSSTQNRQRSNKKSPRKRTRRFAQFTEPRFIKFELHDVKQPDSETGTEIQMSPQPDQRSISMNEMYYNQPNATQYNSDPSTQETKYHYIFKEAPRKQHFVPFPKHHGYNEMLHRANKMQKYIASGQGLQNINTNIEISIPPTVKTTAVVESLLSEYPKQVYGQKLCSAYGYGNRVCHLNSVLPQPPPAPPQQYSQPAQNLDIENEVIPEQHQQQYYFNVYPQPQPDVSQQFIPLAPKPYPTITQIIHVPTVEIPAPQPEPQVAQNLIDTNTLINKDPSIKIAYLEPTYGYGNKLYPYTIAKNIQVAPTATATPTTAPEHSSMGSFDPGADQVLVEPQMKNVNNVNGQYNLLKDNQEFQELSALIGKSPTDQVHGLSYLLAKEMQRQKNHNHNSQRPQDQTSPILFHPKDNMTTVGVPMPLVQQQQQHFQQAPQEQSNQMLMPFRQHRQLHRPDQVEQDPQSTSVSHENSRLSVNDVKAIGLSPNYHGLDGHGHNNNYSPPKTYPEVENDSAMEYASKYAFGYRVRDFDSGNDFSHKENRGKDGVTRGQYHILLPDGRIQNVIYYADDTGFHADVSY